MGRASSGSWASIKTSFGLHSDAEFERLARFWLSAVGRNRLNLWSAGTHAAFFFGFGASRFHALQRAKTAVSDAADALVALSRGGKWSIIVGPPSGRGETGSRVGLRIPWGNPYRFNSCRPHYLWRF